MDIQAASNFERLYFEATGRDAGQTARAFEAFAAHGALDIAPDALAAMRGLFVGTAVSEAETARTIRATLEATGELVDPHTAVGLAAAARLGPADPATPLVTLSTAHPAKFPDAVSAAAGVPVPTPASVACTAGRRERFDRVAADVEAAKQYVREFASA
jgi:threonine synthase